MAGGTSYFATWLYIIYQTLELVPGMLADCYLLCSERVLGSKRRFKVSNSWYRIRLTSSKEKIVKAKLFLVYVYKDNNE